MPAGVAMGLLRREQKSKRLTAVPLPKITIVIPSFNAEATMDRALQSVAAQHYPNLELILVDGGSRDRTMEKVEPFRRLFTHVISEKDRGQAHALNKGFKLATGEIFGWLCADDELAPDALLSAVEEFQKNPDANWLTGACRRVFPENFVINTEPEERVLERISYINGIEQPSTFWRAELHRAAGELDESYHFAFDWAWWNEFKRRGGRLVRTPKILSHYYFSDANKTSRGGTALAQELYRVIKKYGPLDGRLADIWMFLYNRFDLRGCYDRPPVCSRTRGFLFKKALKLLVKIYSKELIWSYNWNFASKQQRGICWYK
jgi:glycosyltransferase involved in cell wall biosynthesis